MSEKRIILVTGSSRGIGKAIAEEVASENHKVYIHYRSKLDEAKAVATGIQARGFEADVVGFDMTKIESIQSGVDSIVEREGGVDVLINNAGMTRDQLTLRIKDEDWNDVIQTNLTGPFACTRACLRSMMKRKNHPRILFLSSVVGQMGNAGQAAYSAAKAGLLGMTKSLARELASRTITVNAIAPGFVKTEMTDSLTESQKEALLDMIPLRRWAEPREIATTAAFLISEEASYITGQVISVNGGMYL